MITDDLSVPELARHCQEETARYLRHEPFDQRFCFELFRRAIITHDEMAWSVIYEHYGSLVRRWLHARPGDDDDLVNAVFARFWQAVDAEKFARFGSLPAVLQYLKMCASAARIDHARAMERRAVEDSLDVVAAGLPTSDDVAEGIIATADSAALWQAVQEALADERERRVIYLTYVVGLPPRAICDRYTADFPTPSDVYILKRRALERLRRVPGLMALR